MVAHEMSLAMVLCSNCRHSYPDSALFCPNCGTAKVRAEGDALLGKVLGERFLVQERLGQGTSGTIYRAEHVTLRRKVAIKVLHAELARDDLAVERFRREATMVSEVDNEHIVEVHDFGRTPDGRLYLAMELLEGETLDATLRREGRLSVEQAADILIQLGEALMEAHAVGTIHRDLRPRNIYLAVRRGKANFVKLLDFGLSKLVESDSQAAQTSLGMTFGDPRYMSPEQARGDRIDRRADIYQMGCIAYEMLTGAPPFTGTRVFDVLTRQVTEAPQPLPSRRPDVPLWMEAAVARMLAKSPDDRFATTSRLVEALRLGVARGEIMEVEVARQRETIPPPSVSRAMEKLGIAAEEPGGAAGRAATIATAIVPPPLSTGAALATPAVTSSIAASAAPSIAAAASVAPSIAAVPAPVPAGRAAATATGMPAAPASTTSPELARKRTGTPRVGVPVAPVAAAVARAAQVEAPVLPPVAMPAVSPPILPASSPAKVADGTPAPVAPSSARSETSAAASAAPLSSPSSSAKLSEAASSASSASSASASSAATSSAGRASAPEDPGVSQAWFEDDDPAVSRRARRNSAASSTDVFAEVRARRKRRFVFAGLGAGVLALGGLALAFMGGGGGASEEAPLALGSDSAPPTPVAPAPVEPAAELPAPVAPPSSATKTGDGAARPTSSRPASAAPSSGSSGSAAKAPASGFNPPASSGEDPLLRRPGGTTAKPAAGGEGGSGAPVVEPPISTPPPGTGTGSDGVSGGDGTLDPYSNGGAAPPPDDAVPAPVKQAEELATTGQQAMARGDIAGAASAFKKATELDAKNLIAVAGLGEIALQQGLFGDAIAHLRKAAKLAPRSARVHTLLGEAQLSSGNNAAAAESFKRALQIDPDNSRARDGYAEATAQSSDSGEAEGSSAP